MRDVPLHVQSKEALLERFGSRFVCTQTMPFVIGTFLRHATDFQAGVLEAVNAGGDTDTNASIVGALIGTKVGVQGIPDEWKNFRPDYSEAETLAAQFVHLFG